MRRDRAADPGMNELLIVAALEASPRLGIERISLNFAMFRSALARGEKIGAGPVLRAWRGLLVFLSRWFQIESLYKFNASSVRAGSPASSSTPPPATSPASASPPCRLRAS